MTRHPSSSADRPEWPDTQSSDSRDALMITLHEAISTKIDNISTKIDNISTKLDTLSAKIDTLSTQTSLQISNLSAFKSDIARAESRLSLRIDNFEKRLSATIAKAVWYENRDLGL
jgi:outer membrane murein-binding lipoprotein Lpp